MHHVIIGNGPAGAVAADTLREHDPESRITLLGDEPEPPYGRMAIPYYLNGQIDEAGTWLRRDPEHFVKAGVETRRARVSAVAPERSELTLDDGGTLGYDRLLIATGSRPNRPPIAGTEAPHVLTCWTLADAREIAKRAQRGSRVVLLGAGFIGCIILEALASRGVELTVVEMAERMVSRMLDANAGGLLQQWCTNSGVDVRTATGVTAIDSSGPQAVLQLSDGSSLTADLVILATGVRSNIDFLAGSGIETDAGVLVDDTLQSSVPGIYAAGDAAQGRDFNTGQRVVNAIQPVAADHGRIAALNMAGAPAVFPGAVAMNVLDTLGLITCSFGQWMGVDGGDSSELLDRGRFRYLNLQFADDRLVGATGVGWTEHVGALRGLIQGRHALGPWKARLQQDPTRVMEALVGCLSLA
ncbi:MAG TPA: FAD-dependent oxidoreductase [Gammaproteobacteria bacterium]